MNIIRNAVNMLWFNFSQTTILPFNFIDPEKKIENHRKKMLFFVHRCSRTNRNFQTKIWYLFCLILNTIRIYRRNRTRTRLFVTGTVNQLFSFCCLQSVPCQYIVDEKIARPTRKTQCYGIRLEDRQVPKALRMVSPLRKRKLYHVLHPHALRHEGWFWCRSQKAFALRSCRRAVWHNGKKCA